MTNGEIEKIAGLVTTALKAKNSGPAKCCGGLTPETIKTINGWAQGGGFTGDQIKALKGFVDMLAKGKKYMLIGIGLVLLMLLKDLWGALWGLLKSLSLTIGK